MGQIMIIGMFGVQNEKTLLCRINTPWSVLSDGETLSEELRRALAAHDIALSADAYLQPDEGYDRWFVIDPSRKSWYAVLPRYGSVDVHRATSPMQLRTIADWEVRQRLLTIPGVSQVFVMGGERKQFQVLVSPDELQRYGVTLRQVKTAVERSNRNATGGYLDEQGPNELLVRSLGRIQTLEDLKNVVVTFRNGRPVLLEQVARIVEGAQVKRGDSSAFVRQDDGTFAGGPAVILTINKQPQVDTRRVTEQITEALREIEGSLEEKGARIYPELYQQKSFIDRAVDNVVEALGDGALLVLVVLFLFLLNLRTTFITLTAIPLSIVITGLVFAWFDLSINTMTLGGLAIAIGELVDDAIVDVENIFRRLRQNRLSDSPKPAILVVFQASVEIRNSIVFGTLIVVLVFVPVFALSGMEGRLFNPLGVAYIVSILSSLLVSLTLTPALSYWLLACKHVWSRLAAVLAAMVSFAASFWLMPVVLSYLGLSGGAQWFREAPLWLTVWPHLIVCALVTPLLWKAVMWADRFSEGEREGVVLRGLKWAAGRVIRLSLRMPIAILCGALAAVGISAYGLLHFERDFLPPFNEGAVQINVVLPPGTSLATARGVTRKVEQRLQEIDDLTAFVRKTGRAELDEHAVTVNNTEVIATFDPDTTRSREEIIDELEKAMADIPGIEVGIEQPLQHLISHMLSGVQAQVAIKLYGDDLATLRRTAQRMKNAISDVRGVRSLRVEPQTEIPQLRITVDGHKLKQHGLQREDVNEFVETAMNGTVVSEVLIGQRTFDLLVRLDEPYRENLGTVKRLSINLPGGGATMLKSVADVDDKATGPNTIKREDAKRRIVVQCNVTGRGLVDVVEEIKDRLEPIEHSLPEDYFIEYGGQFESQESASRVITVLFAASLVGMFLVLYTMFRSANLSLQVMVAVPMAFIGSVAALYITNQTLTVAAMVGFISLCGIASRNGILLINHYLHLVKYEGETWSREMIARAGKERLAPVLMTALTSGIGLVPLAMAAGEPGKEILYPVATVIIGGLISSTLLEFLVRPALFWRFGRGAAEKVVREPQDEIALTEESSAPPTESELAVAE
ncbi:MAG: efflux RND transporter permease subunit [Planctomycetes bacterium]|nr:efflux RND transporter permease subunit [Planctomycetota bacterium]MBL7037257.1 efflux RND transporter permease subunit [Pirellulaceae bacterium]